jgi:alkyl hydroperoxide reductase subunit AhpC
LVNEAQVRKALEGVMDPELHRSLIELGMVRQVRIGDGQVEITPSGWQPGQKTLTPGPALVGKVWQEWKP